LLLDGEGSNAMARLDRDVFDRGGVRYLILFEGINDIEAQTCSHQPYDSLVKQLEWGWRRSLRRRMIAASRFLSLRK